MGDDEKPRPRGNGREAATRCFKSALAKTVSSASLPLAKDGKKEQRQR